MISSVVFSRYARALADVAFEENEEEKVLRDLQTFQEIFREVPDLFDAFDSPAVPRESKERILAQIIDLHPVNITSANFLYVLLDHHRIRYFGEILDAFIQIVNERKGIVSAQVTCAGALSELQITNLRERLSAATGKTMELNVDKDDELLGGLVVRIGSSVYDGSVRRQLVEMRKRLTEA